MKLSVIIPFYNEAIYLGRCLRSLRKTEGVEYILVDDGSTDGGLETVQAFSRSDIKALRFQFNYGVSFARNAGITEAKGEYITFLDADDEMAPDGAENMLKGINAFGAEEIIQFNHLRMENGNAVKMPRFWARAGYYDLDNLPPKWAPVWNKAYKREFIQANGISFPMGQQFDEDRNFNLQCLKHTGGLRCVDSVGIIKHFDNAASLCHTFGRKKATDALYSLVALLEEPQAPAFERLVIDSIQMHLNSKRFKREMGGQL